jgi:methyl-accepting chemotaxis protein
MKIKVLLIILVSVLSIAVFINAFVGYVGISNGQDVVSSLQSDIQTIENNKNASQKVKGLGWDLQVKRLSDEIAVLMLQHRRYEKDFFLNIGSPSKQDSYIKKFNEVKKEMARRISIMDFLIQNANHYSAEDKKRSQSLDSFHHSYTEGFFDVVKQLQEDSSIHAVLANQLMHPHKKSIHMLETTISELGALSQKIMYQNAQKELKSSKRFIVILGMVLVVSLLGGISFGYKVLLIIAHKIQNTVLFAKEIEQGNLQKSLPEDATELGELARALNKAILQLQHKEQVATAIANGDLTRSVAIASEKDALGIAIQKMVSSLHFLLSKVGQSAKMVNTGILDISNASEKLANTANEQSNTLQEITGSVRDINNKARENKEHSDKATFLSKSGSNIADIGSKQMQQMVLAVETMSTSSKQISKIIKVIDDIAFQTNLLALNAAVEAARAGIHGKGFAVVAEEVRNLAGRSAKAAQETSTLIESSIQQISAGDEMAHKASHAFSELVANSQELAQIIHFISQASQIQSSQIEQINHGLSKFEDAMQDFSAGAQESSTGVMEIRAEVKQLNSILEHFSLIPQSHSQNEYQGNRASISQ